MLIDTHCHLHDPKWFTPKQQADFLCQARDNGVEKSICIGTDPQDSQVACDFANAHDNVYWTYGIHPEFATKDKRWDGDIPSPYAPIAIGEIGLDYHYDGYDRTAQIQLLEQMLQLATNLDLPVSLHIREAFTDAFAVLDNFPELQGVVHSFTGSKRDLRAALERGFYIGVNGLCTYTTTPLPPLDRMLLETDAPFLSPAPFRGEVNHPGQVKVIAEHLAKELGVSENEIAQQTTQNANQVFQI